MSWFSGSDAQSQTGDASQSNTGDAQAPTLTGPTAPDDVSNSDQEADAAVAPCNLFAGEVVEITSFSDSVPVSVEGRVVSPPHWQRARMTEFQDAPENTSLVPAAIQTARGSKATMEVKLEVTNAEGLSGNGTLRGHLAGVIWEGEFPLSVGTHNVTVETDQPSTLLAAHRGDIRWDAVAPGCGTKPVGVTRIELYRIADPITPAYLAAGRPVEAFRFLYGPVGMGGEDVATADGIRAASAKVTTYLHGSHGLTYDTDGGRSFYTVRRLAFLLVGYINRAYGSVVNCYDQAAAVHVFSGVLGISTQRVFVQPFGYINMTTLVGGTSTNSPFYTLMRTAPVVPQFDPRRIDFGNHEFVIGSASKIFDACAGPHLGTQSYLEYMNASVDTDVANARPPRPWRPPDLLWEQQWRRSDSTVQLLV